MPRIVDHAERRREIIHGVWQVIHEQGFAAVSLRRVAEAADVSVGRIQHYFTDRDDLLRQGCRLLIDGGADRFAEQTDDQPPFEAFRHLIRRVIPTTPAFAIGTVVWAAYRTYGINDPVIREEIQKAHRGAAARGAELLTEAATDGILVPGLVPASEALRLLATADGYALRVLAGDLAADDAHAALDADIERLRPV